MSQENSLPIVNETSLTSLKSNNDEDNQILSSNLLDNLNNDDNDDNDDWKSVDSNHAININEKQENLTITNNCGWANFDAFQNNVNPNSESNKYNSTHNALTTTASNVIEDDWGRFESNRIHSNQYASESSIEKQSLKINHYDDIFDDYGQLQVGSQSLISTCFPLESIKLSEDVDNCIPLELPSFIAWKIEKQSLACFKHSLSLWTMLSNIANDPLGIQYQWRKSNIERLFHRALGVHKRLHTKAVPLTSSLSTLVVPRTTLNNNKEKKLSQEAGMSLAGHWQQRSPENLLTDNDSSSRSIKSIHSEDKVIDVNKYLDLDYSIPPMQTSTLNQEKQTHSPAIVHRNTSAIDQQNSTPIKTIDLFPGSSRLSNEDTKPVGDSLPNFSFMNPKALMLRTKN
ncbi:unnamed protein product [Rotaria magnacalcarata]